MKLLLILTLGLTTGCLSFGARVRGGPTVDTTGKVGWEVGLAAGIGFGVSPGTAIRTLPAVSVGNRGPSFGTSVEIGAIDRRVGWYAGLGAEIAPAEDTFARWAYGAVLRPLRFTRDRDDGDDKSWLSLEKRTALSVGLEAHAGIVTGDEEAARGLFALLPVLDYTFTSAD